MFLVYIWNDDDDDDDWADADGDKREWVEIKTEDKYTLRKE